MHVDAYAADARAEMSPALQTLAIFSPTKTLVNRSQLQEGRKNQILKLISQV